MLTLLGLLAGVCFACCGMPTALSTWRAGRSVGTPISIAWLIVGGGVAMFAYLTIKHGFDSVLALNYAVEVGSWGVVVKFHYLPREVA